MKKMIIDEKLKNITRRQHIEAIRTFPLEIEFFNLIFTISNNLYHRYSKGQTEYLKICRYQGVLPYSMVMMSYNCLYGSFFAGDSRLIVNWPDGHTERQYSLRSDYLLRGGKPASVSLQIPKTDDASAVFRKSRQSEFGLKVPAEGATEAFCYFIQNEFETLLGARYSPYDTDIVMPSSKDSKTPSRFSVDKTREAVLHIDDKFLPPKDKSKIMEWFNHIKEMR